MLKNTKIAAALAALSLMSLVAIAPMASAIPINSNPYVELQDDTADAGDVVLFDVWDVRAGCKVTTKLDSKQVVNKAVDYDLLDTSKAGAVEDAEITAPASAGEYTVKSIVSTKCKSDRGVKSSDTLYVGEALYFDWSSQDISDDNLATRIYGDIEDTDNVTQDVGVVKVHFYKGKKLIATGTTDSDGYVSVILPSKSFKAAGDFDITVKLSSNADYYMDPADNVLEVTVELIGVL